MAVAGYGIKDLINAAWGAIRFHEDTVVRKFAIVYLVAGLLIGFLHIATGHATNLIWMVDFVITFLWLRLLLNPNADLWPLFWRYAGYSALILLLMIGMVLTGYLILSLVQALGFGMIPAWVGLAVVTVLAIPAVYILLRLIMLIPAVVAGQTIEWRGIYQLSKGWIIPYFLAAFLAALLIAVPGILAIAVLVFILAFLSDSLSLLTADLLGSVLGGLVTLMSVGIWARCYKGAIESSQSVSSP